MQPNAATPAPTARKSLSGQVASRTETLAMSTALQPMSHRTAAGVSGLLCFHTNCCLITTTAGSFADIAAKAAAKTASSLQRHARARIPALKIGVRSIAVAPCSRGRYILVRLDVCVETACASVCIADSQDLTRVKTQFHCRTPASIRIPVIRFQSQRLSSQKSCREAVCHNIRGAVP